MERRILGNSNLEVSAIAFGAWAIAGWMWGGSEQTEALDAIRAGIDNGITSIDTAPAYGQGYSEELIGKIIKEGNRDRVEILTKFGLVWSGENQDGGDAFFNSVDQNGKPITVFRYARKKNIIAECENSLRRLQTDYIDLYQQHWPDPTTPIDETMEALIELKQSGKILAYGVSNYDCDQTKTALQTADPISNQVPYSMLNRSIENELVPYSIEKSISIIAYSPLDRGLLTGKIQPGHQFKEGDHRKAYFNPETFAAVNKFLAGIKPIADEKNATLAQLVLRWTIDQPGVAVALAGARSAVQAIENAKAGDLKISPVEASFINKQLDQVRSLIVSQDPVLD